METAFQQGWKLVKLYFMIGLPTETEDDLIGLADLVNRIGEIARSFRANVKVSISPFTPKAQTPFQWVRQDSILELQEKVKIIRSNLHGKNIKLSWRNPEVSRLEGIIARGDRNLAMAIYQAWQLGARFDAWTDYFDWQLWQEAFRLGNSDPDLYTRARDVRESLPWEHLTRGVTTRFYRQQWQAAQEVSPVEDCKFGICNLCGLMFDPACSEIVQRGRDKSMLEITHPVFDWPKVVAASRQTETGEAAFYCRLQYSRTGWLKFVGHLDLMNFLQRVLRIARLPLAFTHGFSPRPRLTFGPPLPLGMESLSEYLDFQLYEAVDYDIKGRLNSLLPANLKVTNAWLQQQKPVPLAQFIEIAHYEVKLPETVDLLPAVALFHDTGCLWFKKKSKRAEKLVDLKSFVRDLQYFPEKGILHIWLNVHQGETVRIPEVLESGLGLSGGFCKEVLVTRLWQGPNSK